VRIVMALAVVAWFAAGCSSGGEESAHESPASSVTPAAPATATEAPPPRGPPTAERGRALVASHECSRCHDGTGLPSASPKRHCVTCHEQIIAGTFDAPQDALADWKRNIVHLRAVPSLAGLGERFDGAWVAKYLLDPHDIRPGLQADMPRLDLSVADAADIRTYFESRADLGDETEPQTPTVGGSASRGRALFRAKRCDTCHAFSGADVGTPAPELGPSATPSQLLAPDLRHARVRLRRDSVAAWILNPEGMQPDALMPRIAMTEQDASDLAAYVLESSLEPPRAQAAFVRLPVLEREVTYDEVETRVLRRTCWHCHAEPDYARGDGGPGNTGGFGFPARRLNLSSYESLLAGFVGPDGQRQSVLSPGPSGEAVLLEALLARPREERGQTAERHGMPLGLPSLSAEDIQLVESWLAQGNPR